MNNCQVSPRCTKIANKAKELAETNLAQLSIVHVVDYIPIIDETYGSIIPYDSDLTEQIMDVEKERLAKIASRLDIPEQKQYIEIGSPKLEAIRIAEKNDVDLIVICLLRRHQRKRNSLLKEQKLSAVKLVSAGEI